MDSAQAAQMLTWLDEENRKAKAEIGELRDLLQRQAIEMADQRKRYEDLQGRFIRLQTDVSRMTQVDQAIQQLKDQLASVLQGVREEMRRSDQQALQARQVEREAETKAQLGLAQRVEMLSTLADRATAMTAEQQRQNELLIGLRQRMDNLDKELLRRTDQARMDDDERKRELNRMSAMQQAVDSMRSQMESFSARFQYIEKWAQNSAQRAADLQTFRADMTRVQNDLLEAQRRADQRVGKQIREWGTIAESMHRDQEMWANQLRIFTEQHERTKKALTGLQDMSKELRVAQDEARQMLDLGLEKQRRELREWQGENEKRWTRYLAQWDYRWNEQSKADEGLTSHVEDLEAAKKMLDQEMQALRALLAEEMAEAKRTMADLFGAQLEMYQRQMDMLKAASEQVTSRLGVSKPQHMGGLERPRIVDGR